MTRHHLGIKLLALLLLVGAALQSDNDDTKCLELFKAQTHPRECCNYPFRHILAAHQEKCKKACGKSDKTGGCCYLNCNYHTTGVLKNNEFDEKALLELYENYLTENGGGKFDQWMPMVEKSMETCRKLVPQTSEASVCNILDYVLDTMDCVDHQNFAQCPNYSNTTQCEELKSFFDKHRDCGKTVNGTFIIDYRFFELAKVKDSKE